MDIVVDASALAALLFGEPAGALLGRRLQGHALHAPRLIGYELATVAWQKLQRQPHRAVAVIEMLNAFTRLDLACADPDIAEVLTLAVATDLTPGDASYLWLARRLGAPLITLDADLARVAASALSADGNR